MPRSRRLRFHAACLMLMFGTTVAHAVAQAAAQGAQPANPPVLDKGKVYTLQQVMQAGPVSGGQADPQITAALRNVSAAHVRQNIEKLASFVNRNTNGSRDPDLARNGVGIVAARQWIRGQFEAYSKACGGCLEVKEDAFTAQPGNTPEGRAQAGVTTAAPANPTPNA